MDEPLEELEPLFDYSRVQPTNFVYVDEDADSALEDLGRKRNRSNANENKNRAKGSEVLILDDDESDGHDIPKGNKEDDEDWLAPPPKRGTLSLPLEDAAIIQEIRLKKQELQSLALSAETVMQAAIESASDSAKTASEYGGDQGSQPPVLQAERAKIVISIQDKDGNKQFRVYKDDRLEKLFKLYAEKANMAVENLVFSIDGEKVSPLSTPNSLGMEEEDMIEVHAKAH